MAKTTPPAPGTVSPRKRMAMGEGGYGNFGVGPLPGSAGKPVTPK